MSRTDLIKKLFISYKTNDNKMFYKIANEIIDEERKKNHQLIAEDLNRIINSNAIEKKYVMSNTFNRMPIDNEKDIPLVEVIYPDKNFEDIVVTKEKKDQLKEIIREFYNWDVLVSNGSEPQRNILFYGPPGCGKTISANAIANELEIPMLYVRFDALISSYLGETATNIRKVFDYAKSDSYVLFFDEFDAIARSRDDATEHGEIKRVVNAFLQQLDNFKSKSIVIAATNFEKSLDYAIWRRFDETIRFDMPTAKEKEELIKLRLGRFKGPIHIFQDYINDLKLFSHSDIEKMTQIIKKQCILDGRKIYNKKDIEYAIKKQKKLVEMRKTQY